MRFALEQALVQSWQRKSWLSFALLPVSFFMGRLIAIRRLLYQLQIFKTTKINATVVVVGNVIAGGAGKTPTVISLMKHLQLQNIVCGVVSRGYGSKNKFCEEVTHNSSPFDIGDEPLLIFRKTGAPVFVGASRVEAAQNLLKKYPRTQVIVCDDGLQHYSLYRDVEICVFDNRGYGNQLIIPAGPLREPWPRIALTSAGQNERCFLVLHTGNQPAFKGYKAIRKLSNMYQNSFGEQFSLEHLTKNNHLPLMAVAGIAQPEAFFDMLRAAGLKLESTLSLPDHYDFHDIEHRVSSKYLVICTEKDAIKLWKYFPYALCVGLEQDAEPEFLGAFDACLKFINTNKLSLHDGHQTS